MKKKYSDSGTLHSSLKVKCSVPDTWWSHLSDMYYHPLFVKYIYVYFSVWNYTLHVSRNMIQYHK